MKPITTQLAVGASYQARAEFFLDPTVNPDDITIRYELIDEQGIQYLSGNAESMTAHPLSPLLQRIDSEANVVIPDNLDAEKQYMLRWVLERPNGMDTATDILYIVSKRPGFIGAKDTVELYTRPFEVFATLPVSQADGPVTLTIYRENEEIFTTTADGNDETTVNLGYNFKKSIDATTIEKLQPQLNAFLMLWRYVESGDHFEEAARLYVVTPSIVMAANELHQYLNRLAKQKRLPEMRLSTPDILNWLDMGANAFNAGGNRVTVFTMLNAQNVIKHWWMLYSKVQALNALYLEEGYKAFDFQGQAIQLTIDQTQYIQAQRDALQGEIDAHIDPFKKALAAMDVLGGDGSTARGVKRGATGLTAGVASNLGTGRGHFYNRAGR